MTKKVSEKVTETGKMVCNPQTVYTVTDKDEKFMFTGTPRDITFSLAKSDFMVVVSEDDFVNTYMCQMKIRLRYLFDIKIHVTHEDYAGFVSELIRVGQLKFVEETNNKQGETK